jgi:ribonuclease R
LDLAVGSKAGYFRSQMSSFPSLRTIEDLLATFNRALHPRELASRLGLDAEQYSQLISELDSLEKDGRLKVLPGGRVRWEKKRGNSSTSRTPKKEPEETWVGEISVHPKGFAFVTSPGRDDVFIPPDAIYEAMHGDSVEVRVTGRSRKGLEGCVTQVTKRKLTRLAGVLQKKRKSCWLEPDDSRVRGPILLSGDTSEARDGEAAIIEIVRYPQFADELPEGKLVEVLGPPGDPQTEVRKILLRESVSEVHPPAALQNAEQMAQRLRAYRLGRRRDLRNIPLPTIDPEDARDHDDALWVERNVDGYSVYVAIADVSEYVRPESPLDDEARARGCTIYLPDRAIPMLPRALAGDLCSLLPDQDRFCLCVIAELDRNGNTKKFEIVEGLMRSQAKLTYGNVARTLGFDDESPQSAQADAMKENLEVLAELTTKLRKNRISRGALDLDLPEARIVVDDETGAPTEVKKRATRPGLKRAYSLVEEMMLLANELVAQWLADKKAPAIYRVHGKPDEEKLDRLATVTKTLNVEVDVETLSDPLGASKFLRAIQNHERKDILEMLLLRSLKQAVYDTNNIGHFGLASARYAHFTSPIRRYPDLRVHRQIKSILRGNPIDRSDEAQEDLSAAALESSKKERAAMEVEREVSNLYRAIYMQTRIGEEFDGRITGMSSAGMYVSVDDPCVDVLITFEELGQDQFETDELELGVVGVRSGEKLMLGDRLRLEIIDSQITRRTVYGRRLGGAELEDDDQGRRPRRLFRSDSTQRGRDGAPRGRDGAPRGRDGDRAAGPPTTSRRGNISRDDSKPTGPRTSFKSERQGRSDEAQGRKTETSHRVMKPSTRKLATSDSTTRSIVSSALGREKTRAGKKSSTKKSPAKPSTRRSTEKTSSPRRKTTNRR